MKYKVSCIECGTRTDLMMLPHRNKEDLLCGFIYVCPKCQYIYSDNYIETKVIKKEK